MKLIYVANVRLPTQKAHGIQIAQTCEAIVGLGVDLELIIPANLGAAKQDLFDRYGVKRNFAVKEIKLPNFISLGKVGFYINFVLFNLFVSVLLAYRKIIKREDASIYTRGEPIIFLGPALCWFYPIFWESHEKPKGSLILIYKLATKRIKGIVTVTNYYREEIIKNLGFSKNILCAPDGVDFKRFDASISKKEARKKVFLPEDKKIVLYHGSFFRYPYKGVDLILEAAKHFGSDYLFVLLGGTPEEIEKIRADESPLMVLPVMGYKTMPLYLASADLVVLPNKKGDPVSEFYTSPMKLFEYMASGVPIVASNLSSSREILNEESAFLFEPNNAEDFARVIKVAMESSADAQERAKRARELAKNYDWEKRAEKIVNFIKQSTR